MNWTKDQENAVYASPAQLVVSAGAGSGKTQVLTARIIERIKAEEKPVSVDKLLIVTFTKAAAAEMRERIGRELRKAAACEKDSQKREYLSRQLALLGSARICTIDSFCYDVIRRNFFKANLPSDIKIGEAGELTLLKLSALEETVDAFYCALEKSKGVKLSEEDEALATIFENAFPNEAERGKILEGFDILTQSCSSDKRDAEFTDSPEGAGDYTHMLLAVHKASMAAAYPHKWLCEASSRYDDFTEYENTFFGKYAFEKCKSVLSTAKAAFREITDFSALNNIGYETYGGKMLEIISSLCACKDIDSLRTAYKLSVFPRMPVKKRGCDENIATSLKESIKKERSAITSTLDQLLEFSVEKSVEAGQYTALPIKALCMGALLLDKIYLEKMLARKIIDFPACEHIALTIISPDGEALSDVGESIKNSFDEIYIDEVQDSNALQDKLFSLISKKRSFMVGDVKQSIYGFRNADPSIFMEKCNQSSFDENAQRRKIFLSKNFRSRKSVIDAVNSVFDVIMTKEVCGFDYMGEHRLDFGATFIPLGDNEKKCEIGLIEAQGKTADRAVNEGEFIAKKIEEIISDELVWDKDSGEMRPARYSDITILIRNANKAGSYYEAALTNHNIPCFFDGGDALYETSEVTQILEILKLIDNADCDIPLACALRSPMFLFDENELLTIRSASDKSFHESFFGICNNEYKVERSLYRKCKSFSEILDKWRSIAGFLSVDKLIRRIYNDTNIYTTALSFPDGGARRFNLDLLLEKAEEYERSGYSGLFNFITFVEKVKRTKDSAQTAKAINEKMNVVRIMSIHKSKGLEFPIVFVAACSKSFYGNFTAPGGLIIANDTLAMNVINPVKRFKHSSPMRAVLSSIQRQNTLEEEMRILYVALTRARERLFAVGTVKNYEEFEGLASSFKKNPDANEITGAKAYLDLLAMSFSSSQEDKWKVEFHSPQPATADDTETTFGELAFEENAEVSNILNFKYPFASSVNIPNKASVSMLKSLDIDVSSQGDGTINPINKYSCRKISLKKLASSQQTHGAFYGTVHHKMLEYISFDGSDSLTQRKALFDRGILTKEEYETVNDEIIDAFLSSPLAEKMKKAPKLFREEPFVIFISAAQLGEEFPPDEKICVQGIIDCYFENDDGTITLVDYKTDVYDNPQDIAQRYKKQIYYYEKALKMKYRDTEIKKYLYLLHKNDIIEL
ncbi:MAG: UvrD-helicase domain-containing protein [Clostridia bacterium]|nr:UvrD-helicase domain-containing protein [Clostridia bacterium]